LADANERRDWRIYAEFAQRLIVRARALFAADSFGVEFAHTVYALDATTIDLCLSVFPWARFRTTKAAVKLHTLRDLRGSIPSFIHISDGKLHEVNVLDLPLPEAGAFYVMDRGYHDLARLYALGQAGSFIFVARAKRQHGSSARVLRAGRSQHGTDLRSEHCVQQFLRRPRPPGTYGTDPLSRSRIAQESRLLIMPSLATPEPHF
jgi:hypothetical protein